MEISPELFEVLLDTMQGYHKLLVQGKEAPFRKMEIPCVAGSLKVLSKDHGFKTIYVDNSANVAACSVSLDSDYTTYLIPANGGRYIPVEGVETITHVGPSDIVYRAFNREFAYN